jgi:hypothetical protein
VASQGPIEGFISRIIGSNNYDEGRGRGVCRNSRHCPKAEMSRDDEVNLPVSLRSVAEQIAQVAPSR